MKNAKAILGSVLLVIAFFSCNTSRKSLNSQKEEKIEVNEAFREIYKAVQKAASDAELKTLKLKSIDLSFETTTTLEGSAGLKLWVASGKYTKTSSKTKKATFTFGVPEGSEKSYQTNQNIQEFIRYLTSVIVSAQSVKNIDNFGLTDLEVEVEFSIKKTIEGEIEIDLSPITPTSSGSREKEIVHTITLKFTKN